MFNIHKISQRYDSREDRIEVAIQNESGNIIRLWLTQRLANRMVAVLVRWLPDLENDEKVESQTDLKQNESEKSNQQETSVNFNAAAEEGLLGTIDMSQQQKDYVLTFKWGVTGLATIHMGLEQLRSFIAGLGQLFTAAKWDMKQFPDKKINTISTHEAQFEDFTEFTEETTRTIH